MPGILEGLRIIEYTAFVAAPLGGLTLAQLGAEVIRVDPIGGNIDTGRLPLDPNGRSLYWASLNRGKRSVELDVRSPEGQRLFQDLVAESGAGGGIVLTNLPMSGALDYEALAHRRPDLIMLQLTGSPDGAGALDYTVNSAVGFPLVTGAARKAGEGEPVNHVLPAWDLVAGMTIATGLLAAERHRRLTGQGQMIRLTLSDVAMAMTANLGYVADVEINGTERAADGNFLYGAYGDVFATADGRRVMALAISGRQWRNLLAATGVGPALEPAAAALGYRLDDEQGRYEARALISACLRPWFEKRTLAEVDAALTGHNVLWGPYRSFAQMVAEDRRCSEWNPMFRRIEHPGIGSFLTASSPLDFGGVDRLPPGTAPLLGQDTGNVLSELLGLDEARLDELRAAGRIGGAATGGTGGGAAQ